MNNRHNILFALLISLMILSGCADPGSDAHTGGSRAPGQPDSGWLYSGGAAYYLLEDGTRATGWQEIDGRRCLFGDDGAAYTGWLEQDGHTFYYSDGRHVTGIVPIDGHTYFFDSRGWNLQLVNPWNPVPEDYCPALSQVGNHTLAAEACGDFLEMMTACREAGCAPVISSSYRSIEKQEALFNRKVRACMAQGLTEDEAIALASTSVAVPGTSEHQLGLAVDIVDLSYQLLDENQENTPTQQWLMENSWKYGFILRYPNEKSEITGIIYEPWHYRHVGRTLAAELHELDLTLEEYLQMLTQE